ncbi:sulfatase-like hydrolase/transferase [Pseudalkalibacillus decolorationis]|uniref:sulfatase-like hydrolase/transferase n=1 Tax=Pseudalkalibacillus decolorationis TaxID=163879 RepID=UPI002148C6CE|nr:sulfatase-like hydrolase/transferase [Pseudalkalibacillus decolorationis]
MPNTKPNIIFIMTDDQGPWALGCSGNKEIKTPNLDRLAEQGARLENFFCTSPVCAPARASVLTGKIPSQHGVHDFIRENDNPHLQYLDDHLSYTEVLESMGYYCGISGKWGLCNDFERQKGFDHWYVYVYDGGHYNNPTMVRNGKVVKETGYLTNLITQDSLAFLDERSKVDQPFYLSVHYTAPHHLWVGEHPQEYVDMYDDCRFESCPQEPEHPWLLSITSPSTVRSNPRENLKGYFAAVTAMDEGVGLILEKLDELGIRENTLICFMSDNGFSCGQNGIWGKGNGTYPQNMYDNSVKVPAIFSHPGRIPEGSVYDALLSQYDVMPTLLDYVNIENPVKDELPGKSFVPILEGKNKEERGHVVVYDEYGPVRMIRTKQYKYIHRYPYGPFEFYDLVNDPQERNNLYDHPDYQDQIHDLRSRMENWFVQYANPNIDGARLPVTGTGQSNLAGPNVTGKLAFNQNGRLIKESENGGKIKQK